MFTIAYVTTALKLPRQTALLGVIIASAIMIVMLPIYGHLSDRIGRRVLFGVGSILKDLKRRYPAAGIGGEGTDGGPSAYVSELGLTFALRGAGSRITDAWRVSSVWVAPQDDLGDRHCSERR